MRLVRACGVLAMGLQKAASASHPQAVRRRSPRLRSSIAAFTAPGLERLPRGTACEGRRTGDAAAATATTRRARSSSASSPMAAGTAAQDESAGSDVRKKRRPKQVSNAKGVATATAAMAKKKEACSLGRTREDAKRLEGFDLVVGVDEAGRGPFAGPVVAAACFVPPEVNIGGIQDSKKVAQHSDREALYEELTQSPGVIWATAEVGSRRIDEINILEATKEAMTNCVLEVCSKASSTDSSKGKGGKDSKGSGDGNIKAKPFVLVDGNFVPPGLGEMGSKCVIGGDGLEYCIAAASIIAKVTRDRLMIDFGKRWPVYGFERHKGYGTKTHREAIREHGMVEIHRRSFLRKMEAAGGPLAENDV
ncbi:unnamed protein product [Scytosiphon promiscuus]